MTHTNCSDTGKAKARARRQAAAASNAERTKIPSSEGQEFLNIEATAAAKLRSWSMYMIIRGLDERNDTGAASAQRNAVLCLCHFNMPLCSISSLRSASVPSAAIR